MSKEIALYILGLLFIIGGFTPLGCVLILLAIIT